MRTAHVVKALAQKSQGQMWIYWSEKKDLLTPPAWQTPYSPFNSGLQLPLRQLTQAPIFCVTTLDTPQTLFLCFPSVKRSPRYIAPFTSCVPWQLGLSLLLLLPCQRPPVPRAFQRLLQTSNKTHLQRTQCNCHRVLTSLPRGRGLK